MLLRLSLLSLLVFVSLCRCSWTHLKSDQPVKDGSVRIGSPQGHRQVRGGHRGGGGRQGRAGRGGRCGAGGEGGGAGQVVAT